MNQPATDNENAGSNGSSRPGESRANSDPGIWRAFREMMRRWRRAREGEASARDSLDELMEEREEAEIPLTEEERTLVANILSLRDVSVDDVMVPRADIVAVKATATLDEIIGTMSRSSHSRLPVYRETLDDAFGMVHMKDVVAWRGETAAFRVAKILRRILFVPPSSGCLDLMLDMRAQRTHMALVVDEFGGVDGLVTFEDLVEQVVGEIRDEHHREAQCSLQVHADGSLDADARTPIEQIETQFGELLSEDEREHIDTLGGLVFSLAGRIPVRGESFDHSTGLKFEILEADPRRIRRVRVRQDVLSEPPDAAPAAVPRASAR